jgi:hypothetical protein
MLLDVFGLSKTLILRHNISQRVSRLKKYLDKWPQTADEFTPRGYLGDTKHPDCPDAEPICIARPLADFCRLSSDSPRK